MTFVAIGALRVKGDSMTGQIREPKHCDFRFSQIEKI